MGNVRAVAGLAAAIAMAWAAEVGAVEVRVPVEEKKPVIAGDTGPEKMVELKELKPGLVAADLSKLFNSDGMTDEADRSDSDFDKWRQSFSADELPPAGTFEPKDAKTAFLFPAKDAGKKNNVACKGQEVPLGGKAAALHLLVTATDGDQEGKLSIQYDDGAVEVDLKVTDWCQEARFGEKVGAACPSRVAIDAAEKGKLGKEERQTHLWVVAVPLDGARELKSVKLPTNGSIHIFALTLAR